MAFFINKKTDWQYVCFKPMSKTVKKHDFTLKNLNIIFIERDCNLIVNINRE